MGKIKVKCEECGIEARSRHDYGRLCYSCYRKKINIIAPYETVKELLSKERILFPAFNTSPNLIGTKFILSLSEKLDNITTDRKKQRDIKKELNKIRTFRMKSEKLNGKMRIFGYCYLSRRLEGLKGRIIPLNYGRNKEKELEKDLPLLVRGKHKSIRNGNGDNGAE
jgi:hypothetical protein